MQDVVPSGNKGTRNFYWLIGEYISQAVSTLKLKMVNGTTTIVFDWELLKKTVYLLQTLQAICGTVFNRDLISSGEMEFLAHNGVTNVI